MKYFNILVVAIILSFGSADGGILAKMAAYGICQTGCNAVWVACVAAAGGIAGVTTGAAGAGEAIKACSCAQGVCMAACIAAGALPVR